MTTRGTTNNNEWQRVVQQVTTCDTTSDYEWQRVTTNGNEWKRVPKNDKVTANDSEWWNEWFYFMLQNETKGLFPE